MSAPREMTPADQHNQLVDFVLSYVEGLMAANKEPDFDAMCRAIADRFPKATAAEVGRAMEDVLGMREDEHNMKVAAFEAESVFNNQCIALFERFPHGETLGDAIRLGVEAGDEFAIWLSKRPDLLEREIEIPGDEA